MAKNKAHRDPSPPRPADQDERIERKLADFVEAFLDGAAYLEVSRVYSDDGVDRRGYEVRLRRDDEFDPPAGA